MGFRFFEAIVLERLNDEDVRFTRRNAMLPCVRDRMRAQLSMRSFYSVLPRVKHARLNGIDRSQSKTIFLNQSYIYIYIYIGHKVIDSTMQAKIDVFGHIYVNYL